jgi:hypothetical protein
MTEISYFSNLPDYLLNEILLFDKRFLFREGKMITILEITREDPRRDILLNRPTLIHNLSNHYSWVQLDVSDTKSYVMFYYSDENKKYLAFSEDMVGSFHLQEI